MGALLFRKPQRLAWRSAASDNDFAAGPVPPTTDHIGRPGI
ncbi:hypothetical protein CDS [Bradyrhizobium sp.]|nr:hypothetical protein CDS [Bradyrhizobium sp.]